MAPSARHARADGVLQFRDPEQRQLESGVKPV
jgi:hypothetical protein